MNDDVLTYDERAMIERVLSCNNLATRERTAALVAESLPDRFQLIGVTTDLQFVLDMQEDNEELPLITLTFAFYKNETQLSQKIYVVIVDRPDYDENEEY